MSEALAPAQRIAVDVGGTFIDVLWSDARGDLHGWKFAGGGPDSLAAIAARCGSDAGTEWFYSTTRALNALLGGTLPAAGLIVSRGFRELLETARLPASAGATAPAALPARLVPLEHVREIGARLAADGSAREAVDPAEVTRVVQELTAAGVVSIAVALLHSYLDGAQEAEVAALVHALRPGLEVVCSSATLPTLSEYERTLVAALNARLAPLLADELAQLEASGATAPGYVSLMQASGGLAGAKRARGNPLATTVSGPVAAVVGARVLAAAGGYRDLITLDIGGTSTDVALIRDGRCALTTRGSVAGFPLRMPMLDVVSIGAGGGSLAQSAPDGRWHVGPDSAGADPGPACYGRGGQRATLADAELVLGRLPPALLGGELPLDHARASAALAKFGAPRGLDAVAAARGVLAIATENMCGAIRRIIAGRGVDPTRCVLYAMGGAGALHAAELATLLGIPRVLVPPQPGLAAAWGLLVAPLTCEYVAALGITWPGGDAASLVESSTRLAAHAQARLLEEGVPAGHVKTRCQLDLRYAGMTHETTIDWVEAGHPEASVAATVAAFHGIFERATGRAWRDREAVELVNLRVTASGRRTPPPVPECFVTRGAPVPAAAARAVTFAGSDEALPAAVHARAALAPGDVVEGPAIIEQHEATCLVPPGWQARVDPRGDLVLARSALSGSG
ncbi:MAG: hydantoinase/oxoprolinase family protein [Gammaproteobacteria bacterium]